MKEFINQYSPYIHSLTFLLQMYFLYQAYKLYKLRKENIEGWQKTCDEAKILSEIAKFQSKIAKESHEQCLRIHADYMEKFDKKIIIDKNPDI